MSGQSGSFRCLKFDRDEMTWEAPDRAAFVLRLPVGPFHGLKLILKCISLEQD